MPAVAAHPPNDQSPSPFPEGWYFLASRREIEQATLLSKTWMGEAIVAWCDDDGQICVADAYCPHLGSCLGPEAGGSVCNGRLVCPFHGFEFDASGQCVATPFAGPPRQARLGSTRPGKSPAWSSPGGESTAASPNGPCMMNSPVKMAGASR